MKIKIFLFCMLVAGVAAKSLAQTHEPTVQNNPDTAQKSEPLLIAEQMPEFPGGEAALYQFIFSKMQYPAEAKEGGIQGKVVVRFIINKDGSVSDVKVMRSPSDLLSEEAIRVIKLMPNWKPGIQDGKAVAVMYTLPIMFKLQ